MLNEKNELNQKNELKQKLKEKLKEIFQFEKEDLDFGIYKIMNYKRKEIENFIEKELIEEISKQLKLKQKEEINKIEKEIEEVKKEIKENIGDFVFINGELKEEFKNTRLGMKYYEKKNQLEKAIISEDLEKDIYNHLINFFSRYYDKGDFISKRRYGKNEKYVIPYNGEEVLLYWVNKDQYYIKTTEYFRKYTFKVKSDSLTVNFRVVDAQEDKGNIKALERKFFVLNENIFDFDKNKKELNIYFEYRGLTKEEEEKYKYNQSVSQDKINEEIIRILQERIPESSLARLIFEIEGEKTLIEKHLNRYTKRNTTDYFIHKDLKGFLQRELDFYIKNEFLKLEDLQVLEKVLTQGEYFERLRIYFIGISTFRNIALKIIDFLAQIENFQKKLWEKKKFIIDTHYVITLDKIKEYAGERFLEGILDEILGNEKQLKEWEELFGVKVEGREDLIEKNILLFKGWKKLPIDTKYFNEDFKWKLLVALSEKNSLDEILDGVLIKSENFQALNLLLNKYYEKVQTIYIDPPFNKENEADYLYKVGYKDATWITMLENRIKLARELLNERGSIFVRCDYNGNMYVRLLLNEIFGWNNFRNEVIVQTTPGKTKGEGLQLTKAKDSLFIYSYGEKFKFNLYYTTTFESKFLEAIKRIIEKQNIYDQNNKIIELLEEMLWLQLGTRVGERATSSEVSIYGEQSITTANPANNEAGGGVKNIIRLTNNNWGGNSNSNSQDYVAWGNFALPFLNEIFPDDKYSEWQQNGNLNSNEFKKRRWRDSLSTNFPNNQVVRTGVSGCASFFNAVPAGSNPNTNQWFMHSNRGDYTSLAAHKQNIVNDMETAFNFSLPSDITSARPFQINLNFQGMPREWNDSFYVNNRFYNSVYNVYYNHNGVDGADIASAVIRSTKQNTINYYWAVVNGLSPQGSEAQSFVARYSIMSSLYAFLLAGNDTNANVSPVNMLPYLTIVNPTNTQEINTNNINISWNVDFKRWDGNPYIPGFNVSQNPNNYFYLIKYQKLGDNKWYFVQDINGSFPCELGDLPNDNSYRIYNTNYNWNISNLPNDMYWLVVEAHHNIRQNHYSYHMVFINVNK